MDFPPRPIMAATMLRAVIVPLLLLLPQDEALRSRAPWSSVKVESRTQAPAEAAELAERLYGWNCLPCHGPDGKGDGPEARRRGLRPRDFTRGHFRLKTSGPDEMPSDEDLYRTLSAGIASGGMPAFETFDPDHRWALVDRVKALAEPGRGAPNHFKAAPARTRVDLPAGADPDPARGAAVYRRLGCAACHGDDGRGGGSAAAELKDALDQPIAVPDLSRGLIAFKAGPELADIYRILHLGMAGTPMPAFRSAASAAELVDLAAHVRSLYAPVSPGERVYLAAGCQGCHSVGRGRLIGPDLAGLLARRSRDWLRLWLRDPQAMAASDPDARELLKQYPALMPNLQLNGSEIEALLKHFESFPPGPAGK